MLTPITHNISNSVFEKILSKSLKSWTQNGFGVDNLRDRNPLVRLDNIIRGYVGEYVFSSFMKNNFNQISFTENTIVNTDGYNMDIDFTLFINNLEHSLEIKTSGLPIRYQERGETPETINSFINKGKIILIDRDNGDLNKLKGDIHAQILFDMVIPARDKELIAIHDTLIRAAMKKNNCSSETANQLAQKYFSLNTDNPSSVISQLQKFSYDFDPLKKAYFVGWVSKEDTINIISKKPTDRKLWTHEKRNLWNVKINESNMPNTFSEIYLLNKFKPTNQTSSKFRF